ncbi:MAG TPA: methionine synthase [Dermatophilaceae bacterium]|nr:methionine synthase [Dermatophilaceae bacterium]
MTRATGIGSWPGTAVGEAVRAVRDLLGDDDGAGLAYLPELPARGPGSDLVGRTAGLLVEMPVDLQPSGWRLVDRPGLDARRTAALWREDLDSLAEAYDGWSGDLKLQVAGPWTLAASLERTRGERVVADAGAARYLVESLAEGVRSHLGEVTRLVPGSRPVLQVDEPSLPAVLSGELPTASDYGRLPAVDPQVAAHGLQAVLAAAGDLPTVIHCCHPRAPLPLLRGVGPGAVALDLTGASAARWESVAATVEAGVALYAGCLPSAGGGTRAVAAGLLVEGFRQAGLPAASLADVTVTPTCGLAAASADAALATTRLLLDVAAELDERAVG